ncbi:MAG: PqqD family protein [Erythrobacter sp.]|nr:PqqD family protein [Erythrobacter sp.]
MSAHITLEDRFTISDEVVARELNGEMVLLDLASGQYFGLDPVGARIWALLSERPYTLAEICDRIDAEFDAPRSRIEADLVALANTLQEQALIVAKAA